MTWLRIYFSEKTYIGSKSIGDFLVCVGGEIWRRQWHPTPVLLPGKSHGRRSLVGCSHRVAKSQTWLSDLTFTFHFHALEKEVATHSSVLAWRIPGMGEPGGLPSMGSHRVKHDRSDLEAVGKSLTLPSFHRDVYRNFEPVEAFSPPTVVLTYWNMNCIKKYW